MLYTRRSIPIRADFKLTDADLVVRPHEFQVSPLLNMGFLFAGCLEQEWERTGVTTEVRLFVHEDSEDSAQIAEVHNSLRTWHILSVCDKVRRWPRLGDQQLPGARIFKAKPKFPSFRFPQIRYIPDLYLLHKKIKAEFSATRNPVKFAPAERINTFIEDAEEIHRRNLAQGDYKQHPSCHRCVYTLRGAFRHTFLRTWPVGSIREMFAASESVKKATQLGFEINPKFGTAVPPSVPRS